MEILFLGLGISGLTDLQYQFMDQDGAALGDPVSTGIAETFRSKGYYIARDVTVEPGAVAVAWWSPSDSRAAAEEPFISTYTLSDSPGVTDIQSGIDAGYPWNVSKSTLEGYGSDTAAGLILKLDVGAPDEPVIVIPAEPVAASVCRVYGYLRTQDNLPASSVLIRIDLITPGAIKGTYVISGRSITVTTNEDGQLVDTEENPYVELIRNDSLTPAGSRYAVTCEALGLRAASMVLDASTFNISSLIS